MLLWLALNSRLITNEERVIRHLSEEASCAVFFAARVTSSLSLKKRL